MKFFNKPPILSNNFIIYFGKNSWHLSQLSILSPPVWQTHSVICTAIPFCDRSNFNLSNKAISTGTFYTIPLFTRLQYLWHSSSRTVYWTSMAGPVMFPWFPRAETLFKAAKKLFRKRDRNLEPLLPQSSRCKPLQAFFKPDLPIRTKLGRKNT